MLNVIFVCSIRSCHRPGTIHPTRYPGHTVLEKDEQRMTPPFSSNAFTARGRSAP